MTGSLKPYPVMKDSGVPWLGEVPEHWGVRRLKYLLRERDARSAYGTEQLLRVSQYTGVTQRARTDGVDAPDTRAESLVGYKRVEPNELVVNIMLAWNGSMGVSAFPGVASPAYCVYRFGAGAQPWYFHHLLRSPVYKARIKAVSTGVVESRLRLYTDDLYRLESLLPPLLEQSAIVRFLDHADRRIRRYIRAKHKLIKLLEEQKQAIIHRAVTRGLDPSVRLKPSGLTWTEQIPEHWSTTTLGRLTTRIGDGLHGTPQYVDESPYRFINGNNLSSGKVHITQSTRCVSEDEYEKHRNHLDGTTLLLSINGTIGSVAYYGDESIILGKSAAYINCGDRLSRRYLFFLLQSPEVGTLFRREATGTTILNLSLQSVRHLPTLLPPLSEQAGIASFLEHRTSQFSELISKAQDEIELLRQYRTRLIADVITGKLDVREAAARLPREVEEPEPQDEVEGMAEDSENGKGLDLESVPEEAEA